MNIDFIVFLNDLDNIKKIVKDSLLNNESKIKINKESLDAITLGVLEKNADVFSLTTDKDCLIYNYTK